MPGCTGKGRAERRQSSSHRQLFFLSAKRVAAGNGYELVAIHPRHGSNLRITMCAVPEAPEIEAAISGSGEMSEHLSFPPPFIERGDFYLAVPMNEGILFPVEDKTVRPPSLVGYSGHGICMSWCGLSDLKKGIMTIIETPDAMHIRVARGG